MVELGNVQPLNLPTVPIPITSTITSAMTITSTSTSTSEGMIEDIRNVDSLCALRGFVVK